MKTWNLNKMYESSDEIERDIAEVKNQIAKLSDLKKVSDNLPEMMVLLENIYRVGSKLSSFTSMKKDEDSRISESQKMSLRIDSLWTEISEKTAFFEPMLYSIDTEKLQEILLYDNMKNYRSFIERKLRYKKHTLTKEEESILAAMGELGQAPYNDFYNLSYADMKFPEMKTTDIKLNHASYSKLLMDRDSAVRKEAFEKMYQVYGDYENTFGSTLYGNLKYNTTVARLRNYKSARAMALYGDDVSEKVYDGLIESIHVHLPSLKRYYHIRNKRLGLDKSHMYDLYTALTEKKEEISFEKGKELILNALKPLGEDYLRIVQKAFDENWIDIYPRDGKRSGAYSGGCYDSDPYILLNYNGTIDSVFTLAHELGHSVHSYLSRNNNAYFNSSYRIFVAEVASTCNELLLLHYLKEEAGNEQEKLYFLDHHLNSFKSTVFRQTMFAEFEKEIYKEAEKGQGLTGQDFSNIYYRLNEDYFGDSLFIDKEIALEWERVPHFYYGYYVYKYATGFCTATILSQKIILEEEGALEKYLTFLKDGGNHPPLEQLREAGCDIEDPAVLEQALNLFDQLVEEFEI